MFRLVGDLTLTRHIEHNDFPAAEVCDWQASHWPRCLLIAQSISILSCCLSLISRLNLFNLFFIEIMSVLIGDCSSRL